MNLLNLLEPCHKNPQNILFVYAGERLHIQKYVRAVSRIFEGRNVCVVKQSGDEFGESFPNVRARDIELSEPLGLHEAEAFKNILRDGAWDLILLQGIQPIIHEPFNHFRLFPYLYDYRKTADICYLAADFGCSRINDMIEQWREPVRLVDADLTLDFPGFMSGRELAWLRRMALERPPHTDIVEIGRYYGQSTIALAHGLKQSGRGKLYSIDPCLQDGFHERLAQFGLFDRVEAWNLLSKSAYERWLLEKPGATIGMLFIDGDHAYENVYLDISLWSRLLVPDGIIALDDYCEDYDGALLAINELVFWSGDYYDIQSKGKLAFARKRSA